MLVLITYRRTFFPTAFEYHVPQFLDMYGSLTKFNCQPVEKKNRSQSQVFHCGTQKGGKQSKHTIQVYLLLLLKQ